MKTVLTIAGSDSSGGAGIQADLKTIAAHHLYGESVVTAVTAQNTREVKGVVEIEPSFVEQQIDAVFEDIRPDAVKIGMAPSAPIVKAICRGLVRHKARNIVVDPVMVSSSGSKLIDDEAIAALKKFLFPIARIITPNIAEAEILSGMPVGNVSEAEAAATAIAQSCALNKLRCPAILIKGGHADLDEDDHADDLLRLERGALVWILGERVATENTHGTGCTLSSAIACGLASGLTIEESVREAKDYVTAALKAGLDLGQGSGPLDHMCQLS